MKEPVRHQIPYGTTFRKIGPLDEDHPLIEDTELPICFACGQEWEVGDFATFVPVGPGQDPAEQQLARTHQWFSACAVPVHWVCATGEIE